MNTVVLILRLIQNCTCLEWNFFLQSLPGIIKLEKEFSQCCPHQCSRVTSFFVVLHIWRLMTMACMHDSVYRKGLFAVSVSTLRVCQNCLAGIGLWPSGFVESDQVHCNCSNGISQICNQQIRQMKRIKLHSNFIYDSKNRHVCFHFQQPWVAHIGC